MAKRPGKSGKTEKTSVSLPREIIPKARKRAKQLGFGMSFSAYLAKLVMHDLEQAGEISSVSAEIADAAAALPEK